MDEGLPGLDADVSRQLQVVRADFVSMGLEKGSGERAEVLPLGVGDLRRELVMELRVLYVEAHHEAEEPGNRLVKREAPEPAELAEHAIHELLVVAPAQLREERLLVREVLIKRAHRDTRHLRDAVRAQSCPTFGHENASSRFKDHLERGLGPGLFRLFFRQVGADIDCDLNASN